MEPKSAVAPQLYEYLNHIIYIIQGFGMVFGNLLIILTIFRTKSLRRKEMYIIAGLSIADSIYGVGFFSAGIVRLRLVLTGMHKVMVTSWHCMMYFQTIFFFVGSQTSALMLVMLSVDRFMAVVFYVKYKNFTKRYARSVLLAVFTYGVIFGGAAFLSSWAQTGEQKSYSSICLGTWAVPNWYSVYYNAFSALGGFLSVFLYIVVIVAYRSVMGIF